jgi:SAM-dependent methyltransferase
MTWPGMRLAREVLGLAMPSSPPIPRESIWRGQWAPCPLCGSKNRSWLGRRGGAAHRSRLGVETGVVRCRTCHGIYQWPTLLPQANPYLECGGDEYFAQQDQSQAAKMEAGSLLAREAQRLLGRKDRMLELGCGRGGLLMGAAAEGWSVQGVEMTPHFASEAAGVEIEISSIESCRSLGETYGVILLAGILEHIYDPISCLLRCRRALKPGGILFIALPNECGLWARFGWLYQRLRGRRWAVSLAPTFPPFHVVGFCPRSLRRALDRTGFDVIECYTERWDVPKMLWPGERALASIVLSLGQQLGMGMGIICWARVR